MKYVYLLALAGLLGGCSAVSMTPAPSAGGRHQNGGRAYPIPNNQAYPAAQATTYPPPRPTPCQGPKFAINTPLHKGGTTVSGTGPATATIEIVDITQKGAVLGTTKIGPDGSFKVTLGTGLPADDQIGLMGGGADRQRFLCGPGYQDLPTVGIIFTRERVGQ
ncbi:MAG: hypothetical protein H0X37_13885 [Herpetosiphonaceae bacterium]|nr:hypothetical protein [Herpetosiphonaceae bacterium]